MQIAGHFYGGEAGAICRASVYNAMEPAGIEALAQFMESFAKKNGWRPTESTMVGSGHRYSDASSTWRWESHHSVVADALARMVRDYEFAKIVAPLDKGGTHE